MEIVNEINRILGEVGHFAHYHSVEHLIHSFPTMLVSFYESYFYSTPDGIISNPTNTLDEVKNIEIILTALKNYNKSGISAHSLISGDLEALRGAAEIFSFVSKSLPKPNSESSSSPSSNEMNELDLILEKVKLLDERLDFEISQTQGFLDLRSEALKLKMTETAKLIEVQDFQLNNSNAEKDSFGTPCKVIPHQVKRKRKMKKKPKEMDMSHLEVEPNETKTNNAQAIIPSRPSSGAPSKRKPMVRRMLAKDANHLDKQRPGSAPTQKTSSSKDNQSSLNQDSRLNNEFSVSANIEKFRLPNLHKNDTGVHLIPPLWFALISSFRNTRTTSGQEGR
jgi:hypothetical protein